VPSFVVGSFITVAVYMAVQIWRGRLLTMERSPMPFMMRPPPVGWVYVLSVLSLIYLQSPLYAVVVLAGVAGIMTENRTTVGQQFGLYRMKFSRAIAWGLLVFGAVTLFEAPLMQVSVWLLEKLQVPHPEQQSVETFRQYTRFSTIAFFLFQAVLVSPMIEEIFFRGFLLTFLKNYTSTLPAIILSAGVFAFAHLNLAAALPLWFLGIALGIAYEHTGSIIVPMMIHSCFNLATGLSLLIEKGSGS
jgi:membrane protease YdiL (CAAX protease family)